MKNVCLLLILELFTVQYISAVWPSSNLSNIQLLGLFQGSSNVLTIHSQAMFKAAILLSQQYNLTIEDHLIGWQTAETGGNVINALSSTCRVISNSNIFGIVGPTFSREAHVIANLGETFGIPVVSYSATDPDLSDRNAYTAFYRTVSSDNAAAESITKLFMRFNWTSAVIICQNDAFGIGGAKAIALAFQNNGLIVSSIIAFDIAQHRIRGDLKEELTNSPTRIVILWTESVYASIILQNALEYDVLGPKFTWISRSNVPLDSFNQTSYRKLIGLLTIEPTIGDPINSTLLNAALNIWKQYERESFPGPEQVNYHGLFAFDATWSLIQSLKQLCSLKNISSTSCISVINSSFCFDYRFRHADLFFDTIKNINFLGVSGPIQFDQNLTDRINGSYYLIKNIQSFPTSIDYIPVLKWSDFHDWQPVSQRNVIVWPGNTLIPPSGRATLSGVKLRIGVIESRPFTISTEKTEKLVGFVPDLIDILQKSTEFIPEILLTPSNQTYDGLINSVINGDYDIVIGDVTVTATRRERVGFSNSIFDNALRIIMRKNIDDSVDYFSYLRPFSFSLWILLFATSIYAGFLICLLERRENEAIQDKSIVSSLAMSSWYSIGTIMGYGADFHSSTAAGRLLTLGLYFLSLVLVATYTANLTSSLTISKFQSPISGIDDIKNGKIPFHRIGIRVGTSDEDFYLREISGGIRNYYPIRSRQEIFDALLNNLIDVYFMDNGVAEYVTNAIYCNLTLVGAEFDKGAFGIVVPKQWVYGEELDINILSLRESGVLDELKRKWFQTGSCPDSSVTSKATTVEEMSGLFLTFAMITVLSVLLLIWKRRFIIREYLSAHICRNASLQYPTSVSKFSGNFDSVLP